MDDDILFCYCAHRKNQHQLFKGSCDNCNCKQFALDMSDDSPNMELTAQTTQWKEPERFPDKEGWLVDKEKPESLRSSVLNEAEELVTGDRNNTYGEPHQDFARTAGALTSFGYRGPDGRDIQAHDIAIIIGVVKMSRLMWTPTKRDSWVDLAGYAACGYEAAELTLNTEKKEV